jgi:Mrp family chromosome partitioning ATPase
VDCPSLKEAQDAILLAPLVDGIVLVVEADRTHREQLLYVERSIELANGKIMGHVLNKRSYVVPDWLCRKMEAVGI